MCNAFFHSFLAVPLPSVYIALAAWCARNCLAFHCLHTHSTVVMVDTASGDLDQIAVDGKATQQQSVQFSEEKFYASDIFRMYCFKVRARSSEAIWIRPRPKARHEREENPAEPENASDSSLTCVLCIVRSCLAANFTTTTGRHALSCTKEKRRAEGTHRSTGM